MGQQSRTAVKAMQVKYGLPADSWPTAELLARMRGPRAEPAAMAAAAVGVMPRFKLATTRHGIIDRD